MKYCTSCGRRIPDGTKFCPYCGTPQRPDDYDEYNEKPSYQDPALFTKQLKTARFIDSMMGIISLMCTIYPYYQLLSSIYNPNGYQQTVSGQAFVHDSVWFIIAGIIITSIGMVYNYDRNYSEEPLTIALITQIASPIISFLWILPNLGDSAMGIKICATLTFISMITAIFLTIKEFQI